MESFTEIDGFFVNYCISAASCNDGTQDFLTNISKNNRKFKINIKRSMRTRWNWIYLKNLIPADTDWVWLFGDDDIILHPQGWMPIYKLIQLADVNNADIISIPQSKRIYKEEIYIDDLINLSSRFGLHEVLGWMTSIIVRRSIFINLINAIQARLKYVYTDHGMLVKRISPFLHSLILLSQNTNSKVIFALQKIVDEQVNISEKNTYTTHARISEHLRDRLPFTFSEFKEFISFNEATKNISFYRYVNKTYFDLFINIICELIIENNSEYYIKLAYSELYFIYDRLKEKDKAVIKNKMEILNEYINIKKNDKEKIISIYKDTKKDYLGNFIGDDLYRKNKS